jgi:hypothetical protein
VNADGSFFDENFVVCSQGNDQDQPSVAYDSANQRYLVVWHDYRNGNSNQDIYGQLLNINGAAIGTPSDTNFFISNAANDEDAPSVAYDSVNQRYLVVWQDNRNINQDIYGQIVNADGSFFNGNFAVCNEGEYQDDPSVAYDSANQRFLVAWQDNRNGGEGNIYGQLVNAGGSLYNTASNTNFVISNAAGGGEYNPSVAYDSTNKRFLVAWEADSSTSRGVFGQVVNADGSLYLTASNTNFVIADAAGGQNQPSVVFNSASNNFLAAFETEESVAPDIGLTLVGPWCTTPPEDMVNWWKGDGSAIDIIGGNNGTPMGGATYAPGKVGKAFSFDGEDDYVAIPNGIIPATARIFTIDAWVYPDDVVNQRQIIYGGSGGGEYQLGVEGNSYYFKIKLNDNNWYVINTPATVNLWAFVAAVRRGSSIEIWVDGVLKNSAAIPDWDLHVPGSGNNSRIGAYNELTTVNKEFWDGLIDEVEIFNRDLSVDEIADIYKAKSAGKCAPQNTLTVTKTGTGSGTVTTDCTLGWIDNTGTCTVDKGTPFELSGDASAGSDFTGWSDGTGSASSCTGTGTCSFTITEDSSVTADFAIADGPDLTGEWNLVLSSSKSRGRTIHGNLLVQNIGNQRTDGRFNVKVYISDDGTTLGRLIYSKTVSVSKPSHGGRADLEYKPIQMELRYPGKYAIALIDSAEQIAETNENNNKIVIEIPGLK